MKKILALILAVIMVLSLAACGEKPQSSTAPQEEPASAESSEGSAETPEQPTVSGGFAPATDGTITISKADVAIVINGTAVLMPYKLADLEAAGVPADESRSSIELGAGDIFSANLYLDENEDYLLIPAYYNGGDSSISIMDAEAEEITMTTYSDTPEDQGVSLLGVSFGMPRSEVVSLLGTPTYETGDYYEWHVEVPDMAYEGTVFMYFTEDADDAGVSQIDLTVFEK